VSALRYFSTKARIVIAHIPGTDRKLDDPVRYFAAFGLTSGGPPEPVGTIREDGVVIPEIPRILQQGHV